MIEVRDSCCCWFDVAVAGGERRREPVDLWEVSSSSLAAAIVAVVSSSSCSLARLIEGLLGALPLPFGWLLVAIIAILQVAMVFLGKR